MTGSGPISWINKQVVLASASPRRKMLIKGLDIPYRVVIPEENGEVYPSTLTVEEIPVFLARQKATLNQHLVRENTILLTADTVVIQHGQVIQKPVDRKDAIHIVKKLSGSMHTVLTGVCLRSMEKEKCFTAETKVWFGTLSKEEITYYIDKYKPYDKAGAYGIQEWIGYVAIERIEGSFYNVMGLPVHQVYDYLKTF